MDDLRRWDFSTLAAGSFTLRKTNVFQTVWRAGGELWPDGVVCGACLREYLEMVQAFLPDLVRQAYDLCLTELLVGGDTLFHIPILMFCETSAETGIYPLG